MGRTGTIFNDIQLVGVIFAALFGLAFGSFLNVAVSRLPEDESIASPRSHCRNCSHVLTWWENLPLLSWLLLRGRCRECRSWIGLRYPLVELAVGVLWTSCWLKFGSPLFSTESFSESHVLARGLIQMFGYALLCWILVALAALDAEQFWLPDWLTIPGIALGLIWAILQTKLILGVHFTWTELIWQPCLETLVAGGVVLIIRLAYWLIRRREGMGLGDAKLMAMLGAWLGLVGAMESFALAVVGATIAALVWLAILAVRRSTGEWAKMPLPLGTFLCLAALSEVFWPSWLWTAYSRMFLNF